jgi:hypothetical protein
VFVTGYAYPWDVSDQPGFLDRVAELGVDEVVVAAAYHTARAAVPWSHRRSMMVAEHAAIYRPVREQAWAGRSLRPTAASWVDGPDSAGDAVRRLAAAGVRTGLWLVLTHNSLVGKQNPDATVRNCFGERYSWALCPSRPQVRDYAATLAAECVRDLDPHTVILESCGPMGAVHQYMHEKTDGVWAPSVARLLSVCCCDACTEGWRAAGLDVEATVAALRREIRRLLDLGELGRTGDELPTGLTDALLAVRQRGTDALRAQVLAAIGRPERLVLHGSPDPWATGALPGLTPTAAADVDSVVVQCWQPGPVALDTVRATRADVPSTVEVGAYVTGVAAQPVPDMSGYVRDLAAAGATELHLYHLGLAGPARWPHLRAAVATAHAG